LGIQKLPLIGEPTFSALKVSKTSVSPLLQALQKDKMAEAYSEIGMKGEVSVALSIPKEVPNGSYIPAMDPLFQYLFLLQLSKAHVLTATRGLWLSPSWTVPETLRKAGVLSGLRSESRFCDNLSFGEVSPVGHC
jgi:hypothetical protein